MSSKLKATYGVLGALVVAGVAAWIYQLANGLGVTGMNNGVSWGLYITCFMFFVGLSAGGLIVASSASVFHIAEYKKVALPAVICSTVCICLAGMFVLIDMGGIQRVWRIVTGPNLTSPLLWDVCVITCYLIINIVYLVFMCSKKPGAADKVAIVSRFALPVAILVHSVTAWIFGLQMAKDWYSAIMAPIFVASAMDSGLALLLLALMGLNKSGLFKVENKLISSLAGLLAVCIAVDAFFIGCECLTMAYPGRKGRRGAGRYGRVALPRRSSGSRLSAVWSSRSASNGVREEPREHEVGRFGQRARGGRRVLQARVAAVHVVLRVQRRRRPGRDFRLVCGSRCVGHGRVGAAGHVCAYVG